MKIPLTANHLRKLCGKRSSHTQAIVGALHNIFATNLPVFAQWRETAFVHTKKTPKTKSLAARYGLPGSDAAQTIFLLQTYYALVVKLLAARHIQQDGIVPIAAIESGTFFRAAGVSNFIEANPYNWYVDAIDDTLATALHALQVALAQLDTQHSSSDVLKALYQDIFPAKLRHDLGEYYTPDWLAEHLLDRIGFTGNGRVLDPACGSGTFLLIALRRMQASGHSQAAILNNLIGIDVNPLACLSAKANLLLNLGQPRGEITLPIHCTDTILKPPTIAPVEYIVGNPPWINWETLPQIYREKTQHLWEHYQLFPHGGMESILGKGKKDLSALFTYACIDRHLVNGGQLGFLLSKTLLKSGGSGAGFRQFTIGDVPLGVCHVDDWSKVNIFSGTSTQTIALVVQKNRPMHYPVPYHVWRKQQQKHSRHLSQPLAQIKAVMQETPFVAEPISTPESAWLTGRPEALSAVRQICGQSDYRAHAGAYTGGANGVYWLDILAHTPDGVHVRNIVDGAKRPVPQVEAVLEPDLIFPLLRGRDVARWQATSQIYMLVVQNPKTRSGYQLDWMARNYPRTLAYLAQFEDILKQRATYRRYFKANVPFYTMFDVGPYTFAPFKVVWKGFGTNRMQAVVVTKQDGKPIMPNQAMHPFIGVDNEDEAHYLAACLNSAPFEFAVMSYTQPKGKSFAQPGILEVLRLPRYQADSTVHQDLANLSKQAHAGHADDDAIAVAAAQLWHLSPTQLADLQDSLVET